MSWFCDGSRLILVFFFTPSPQLGRKKCASDKKLADSLTFGNTQPQLLLGEAAERGLQSLGHHLFTARSQQGDVAALGICQSQVTNKHDNVIMSNNILFWSGCSFLVTIGDVPQANAATGGDSSTTDKGRKETPVHVVQKL